MIKHVYDIIDESVKYHCEGQEHDHHTSHITHHTSHMPRSGVDDTHTAAVKPSIMALTPKLS
jgi:hypothetical protein